MARPASQSGKTRTGKKEQQRPATCQPGTRLGQKHRSPNERPHTTDAICRHKQLPNRRPQSPKELTNLPIKTAFQGTDEEDNLPSCQTLAAKLAAHRTWREITQRHNGSSQELSEV